MHDNKIGICYGALLLFLPPMMCIMSFLHPTSDINECEGNHGCPNNSRCVNSPGSFDCECNEGFRKVGDECEREFVICLY